MKLILTAVFTALCSGSELLDPAKGLSAGLDSAEIPKEGFDIMSAADHGLDMSTVVTSDAADCMSDSYSFIIPRGYHSSGSVDTNVCTSINHGNAAGIKVKDCYMFPCPTCSKSAATQGLISYIV